MSTMTRTLVAVGTTVAALAIGVVGARAIQGDADPAAAAAPVAPVVVDQPAPPAQPDAVVPMVAPVVVGDDPTIGQQLIDSPAEIPAGAAGPEVGRAGDLPVANGVAVAPGPPDLSTATPVDGTVPTAPTTAPEGTADGTSPAIFPLQWDPTLYRLFDLPWLTFDICAGPSPRPDTLPPPGCPDGFGGTVAGLRMPPAPFMFLSSGHATTSTATNPVACPAGTAAARAGQTPVTVYSQTPLETLRVQWRPYGTSLAWQTLDVAPATLATQADAWTARLEAEEYDRATWGLIPRCLNITRDPNQGYETLLTATDIFGREVTANRSGSLPDATPDQRPPSQGTALGLPTVATITGWTTDAGSVTFAARNLTDPTDRTCPTQFIEDEQIHRALSASLPSPVGIWDPDFDQAWVTNVPMAPGGTTIVCVTVYDSANTLRPAGTDVLVLTAPMAQSPVITLEGLRLNDGVVIEPEDLWVVEQAPDGSWPMDGCDHTYVNDETLSGGVLVQQALWECTRAPLPTDATGYVKVPITVTRDIGSDRKHSTWGIPIQLDDCSTGCPPRPTEWYEIPVPSASSVLCGETFWSDGECPQPSDGAAIVKVTYPVALGSGGRYGTATLASRSDRPAADPTSGAPRVSMAVGDTDPGLLPTSLTRELTIFSDRAIRLTGVTLADAFGGDTGCAAPIDVAHAGAAATEARIVVPTPCLGWVYSVTAHYTDATGAAYEQYLGFVTSPSLVNRRVSTRVEFLGGTVPALGHFYRFAVSVDGADAAPTWLYRWDTTRRGTSPSCMGLDGTTATSPSSSKIVHGSTLDVAVRLNITTTGDGDCSGRSSSGLGEITLSGSFPIADVVAGEPLVLTTPADARLQIRVTVTTDAAWLLSF